jgi:RNA polymerase sigma-70 factor (ECF subfamily)
VLDAFRRGEPEALTRVYRAYAGPVARYLARSFSVRGHGTGSTGIRLSALDLEDAHQETFVRAFSERLRKSYDGLRPYEGFLCVIARSTAIDLLRSKGKVAHDSVAIEDEGSPMMGVEKRSPEEQTLEAELKRVVRTFLETLDPQLRQLAELRFAEGQAQESCAETLGLTRSEVRTREKRVREAFAAHLAAVGWGGGSVSVSAATLLLATFAGGLRGLA